LFRLGSQGERTERGSIMRTKAFLLFGVLVLAGAGSSLSHAVVTTAITPTTGAGNLGTIVTQNGTVQDITGGTRPGGGPNLFHSFGLFSVGAGDTANFLNDSGLFTTNILSRVTGGLVSNIFGTIQTTGFGNASLFLINPAGVVFGPTASLNVGGSFHVSTADYLRLADGARFNAMPGPEDATLTSAPVAAFGFLNPNPAAIAVEGSALLVPAGQAISFVGGDVTMAGGSVSAPNGQINLASVASPGEILHMSLQPAPNVNGDSFTAFGTVNLSQAASLDVSGAPGGTVLIRGGQFVLDGAFIKNVNSGDAAVGDIAINSDTVGLINGAQIVSSTEGAGDGGRIVITATESASISGFDSEFTLIGVAPFGFVTSGVFTTASSTGNGGDIAISAPTVTVDNGGTVGTITSGDGRGGNISVNVGTLNLQTGGQILSFSGVDLNTFEIAGTGAGGNITVTATESVLIAGVSLDVFNQSSIQSSAFSSGRGGNIMISAPNVSLEEAGMVASGSLGEGAGGSITISASNALSLSGFSEDFQMPPAILSIAFSNGDGGAVTITAGSVTVADRGTIETQTFDQGRAGDITLVVGNLTVTGGGKIEILGAGTGPAGNVTINATGTISLAGLFDNDTRSGIFIDNEGDGATGLISIQTGKLMLSDDARIRSDSFGFGLPEDPGGLQIKIAANDSITVSSNSKIAVRGLFSDVGGIEITAPTITLDQGIIQTTTVTDGNAGPVSLNAGNLTISGGGFVISSTEQGMGNGGPIVITASGSVSISGAGSGLFSESLNVATGRGGDIQVQASQVALSEGATMSAKSSGTGDAGNIKITASDSVVMQSSSITAETTQSDGGNITLHVGRLVELIDSKITTSVQGGLGNGGNITIDPQLVILQNSQIIANAFGGNGGNILIVAGVFLIDPFSTVSASSTFGLSGTVEIQASITNLSGTLAPLPGEIVQVAELLQARCAARLQGGQYSSFVVAGRDGLPLEPGGFLPSPLFAESQGSTRPSVALNAPNLRVARTFVEPGVTFAPLELGCAS